jgi:hypothetical protein
MYVWRGFCMVALEPSPKSQCQAVGVLKERSVNWTESGAFPKLRFMAKTAIGA